MMNKIKVILWDIDGTLLNFKAAEKAAIKKGFQEFGLGTCTDEMLARYSAINHGYWKRLERGELTKQQVLEGRFQEFFALYDIDAEVAPAFNLKYQKNLGDTVCFEKGAYEVVQALKGKAVQCAVTNGTRIAQDIKLKKSGLNQLLDYIFISEEVGVEKPGVEFFHAVWSRIGHYEKKEILIVGDSLTSDMKGGNNAGILCGWYNPEGEVNDQEVNIDYEIKELRQVLDLWTLK